MCYSYAGVISANLNEGVCMRVSSEIEELLEKLDDQSDLVFAEEADARNNEVYQRVSELSAKRDQLKIDIAAQADEELKKEIELEMERVDRDLDALLNQLSKESMQF
jgi:outer membrane murein-binding lipoprotein Lpp